jgi:kynurenine formamidase
MNVLDLSQDFSVHTPAFASYDGPSVKWVKRLAFDRAGGQEITSTLHVGTHLDAPAHFYSGGKFIGDLPLECGWDSATSTSTAPSTSSAGSRRRGCGSSRTTS